MDVISQDIPAVKCVDSNVVVTHSDVGKASTQTQDNDANDNPHNKTVTIGAENSSILVQETLSLVLNSLIDAKFKDRNYICDSCREVFQSHILLEKHMKNIHPGCYIYNCEMCDFNTNFKQAYKHHIILKHTPKEAIKTYTCQHCEKEFLLSHKLQKHLKTHSSKRNYFCSMCDYSSATKENLALHQKRRHPTSPPAFTCTVCDKSFVYMSDYRRHIIIHSDIRLFPCDFCDFQFNRRSNLKKHIERVHLKINIPVENKQHYCQECEKGFGSNCDLQRHISGVHCKERPFACHLCDYQSNRKSNLSRHLHCKHELSVEQAGDLFNEQLNVVINSDG